MTLDDFVQLLGKYPLVWTGVLCMPPLISILLTPLHGPGNGARNPWKYLYTLLIYAVCIPGIFAGVLTAYLIFFQNENILKLDVRMYVLPVVSMLVTLLLIRRNISSFDDIPGFGRLSGLMVILAISFGAAFVLQRMHFGIVFLAPLAKLGAMAAVVFALLHWGVKKFGGEKEKRSFSDAFKGKDER